MTSLETKIALLDDRQKDQRRDVDEHEQPRRELTLHFTR